MPTPWCSGTTPSGLSSHTSTSSRRASTHACERPTWPTTSPSTSATRLPSRRSEPASSAHSAASLSASSSAKAARRTPMTGSPERAGRTRASPVTQVLLDPLHLGGQLAVVPRADVGLEHQTDARVACRRHVDRLLDDGHHLVPLPLDVGEHRVGLAGQSGVSDDPHDLGHHLADSAAGLLRGGRGVGTVEGLSGRADAEGDEHVLSLPRERWSTYWACSRHDGRRAEKEQECLGTTGCSARCCLSS